MICPLCKGERKCTCDSHPICFIGHHPIKGKVISVAKRGKACRKCFDEWKETRQ